jgi:hypothetical protein
MSTAVLTKVKTAAELVGDFNAIVAPHPLIEGNQFKNIMKQDLYEDIMEVLEQEGFTPAE